MPSDPYDALPNLSGSAGEIERIRSDGDPARFFPSVRGSETDAVTGRILNVPRANVYFTTAVNATTSGVVWTVIWEAAEYDTNHMWDPAAPTRLTVHTPGLYSFWWANTWIANAFGDRTMYLIKGGTGYGVQYAPASAAVAHYMSSSVSLRMNTGDYVEVWMLQNTGVGLSLFGGLGNNYLGACLISTFGSDNQ